MGDYDIDLERIYIVSIGGGETAQKKVTEIFKDWVVDDVNNTWYGSNPLVTNVQLFNYYRVNNDIMETYRAKPQLETFPLSNIDDMRMDILSNGIGQFTIDREYYAPYGLPLHRVETPEGKLLFSKQSTQEGLGIKTYQSDLFNNWVSTEWIDGENGINELTKVKVTDNSFTIDELNLSKKLYDMSMLIS